MSGEEGRSHKGTNREDSLDALLSVVIPAYNEEQGIATTLAELRTEIPRAEIIIVDDGSTDRTVEEARTIGGVKIVCHQFNRGYGAALKSGMLLTTRPFIAWFDADNEHRVEDLQAMLQSLANQKKAAIIGERKHSVSTLRRFGKTLIRMLAWSLGTPLGPDVNCGLRIFRREAILPYLQLLPDSFSASLTSTMTMLERGYPVLFHPIAVKPRMGKSKVRVLHGFHTLYLVLRMVMLFAPLRILFKLGALLVAFGTFYGIFIFFRVGMGWPIFSVLVMLMGFLMIVLGLIADQISQMRLGQLSHLRWENEILNTESSND